MAALFLCAAATLALSCAAPQTPSPSPPSVSTSSAVSNPAPPPAPKNVTAEWIVREDIAESTRWLLVAGSVHRGAESDPPPDADYVPLRVVDEAFARTSQLPVRTFRIPKFYTLPESFEIRIEVETEPPGARVYEVVEGGALVPHGVAPVTITYPATISDTRVTVAGRTWLAKNVEARGLSVGLWAATDTMASSTDVAPRAVPLLDDTDLATVRKGSKVISKRLALPIHTPITPRARAATISVVVVGP